MTHPGRTFALLTAGLIISLGLAPQRAAAKDTVIVITPPKTAVLKNDAWVNAPITPVTSAELDQLVARELQRNDVKAAALVSDEQFIRRVTLDLIGHLPAPAEVEKFVADKDPKKRPQLIDKLLDSEDFAKHWARYWRDVIGAKVTDRRGLIAARAFEAWMAEQLKANKSWADVTKAMLTAEGHIRFDEPTKNGETFFLLAHTGAEGANDRAAETSRVFLGIQIRCAQCHDHPFDQWKQTQFHELAAYYARVRDRFMFEDKKIVGIQLVSTPRGEHEMSVKNDPKNMQVAHPRFLDGNGPAKDLSDRDRRAALAASVIDKNNYWFAGAYANRIWGSLMGQSFYQPVDDMGPEREAVFGNVLVRLASSFRATQYDQKALFRVILNTQTYQRQIRLGETTSEHLLFAASYPSPLRPDSIMQSLSTALGVVPGGAGGGRPGALGMAFRGGLGFEVQQLFDFDPSAKADEIEGSIAQALLLMNSPTLNEKIKAKGETPLAEILKANPVDDTAALKALYQRTLARQPTDKELGKCLKYIKKVGNRAEAFEDVQWTLINSTEFQTKR